MKVFKILCMVAFGPTLIGIFTYLSLIDGVGKGLALMSGLAVQNIMATVIYAALKWDSPSYRLRRMCRRQLIDYQKFFRSYEEEK